MSKKNNEWGTGESIQLILLLIVCPIAVLIDLATGFSVTKEHPIFSLGYYIVTIFEIYAITSKVISNHKEEKEKEQQEEAKKQKQKEIEEKIDITDNDELEDIFEIYRTEDGFSIETYIGFNDSEIIIPKTFHGLPIIEVSDGLFKECKELKKLEIYAEIKEIPKHFAESCTKLETVIMSGKVQYIEEYAFSCCKNLKNITCGRNIYGIGNRAFCNTCIENLSLFPSITYIGEGAFSSCMELTSIKIPTGVNKLPKNCFSNCANLQEIDLPNRLTTIDDQAFLDCIRLKNILIPKSVNSIGENVFSIEDTYRPDRRYNPTILHLPNRGLTIYCYPGSYTQQRFRGEYNMEHANMYKKE